MPDAVTLALLGALSGFVSGLTGFGSGLILMGTLVAIMSVQQATVISAVLAVVLAGVNTYSVRRDLPWREIWPTLTTAVPAVAAGVWLLTALDDRALKIAVAAVILLGVVSTFLKPRAWHASARWPNLIAGAISGLFNGALGMGGPPLVIYTLLRGWEKEPCKGYYSVLFLLMGLFRMVLLVTEDVATREGLGQGVFILVPVLAAWYVGERVFQRVSTEVFRYAGAAMLVAVAVNLLAEL